MRKIYIVLSYTGTILSKMVKLFTKYKYSHVSISLNEDMKNMSSFGRKKYNNPFIGGFVIENKNNMFYKKFNKTKCIILELEVEDYKYEELKRLINDYKKNINIYKYDFIGLLLKIFKISYKRKNYNVCSEFVGRLLEKSDIYDFNKKIIRPIDFLNINDKKIIYEGLLLDYIC